MSLALLLIAACAYFLSNTIPVAIVISLTEGKPFQNTPIGVLVHPG